MSKNKRKDQAGKPRSRMAGAPATRPSTPTRAVGRWALLAAVLGLAALISGAIYLPTRTPRRGVPTPGEGQPPAGAATTALSGEPSNRLTGLAPESATSSSNWDAIAVGKEKDREASELTKQANDLLASGDSKGAIRVLEEALRLTPDDENLRYNLGIAYGRVGDVTNAERQYREALRLLPDYPEVHNNLGNLFLHAGRLAEAEVEFTEAIKSMPELATAHNNLGIVRQRQNRMPEAIVCFRKAVQYNTNYWQAHFNLAMASISQGAKDEGRQELEAVLRLNPGYAPAQRALDKLQAQPAKPGP